jgi:hypothetical protein
MERRERKEIIKKASQHEEISLLCLSVSQEEAASKIISINCKVLSNEVFCFHWVKATDETENKRCDDRCEMSVRSAMINEQRFVVDSQIQFKPN